jgi:hypothetical protein
MLPNRFLYVPVGVVERGVFVAGEKIQVLRKQERAFEEPENRLAEPGLAGFEVTQVGVQIRHQFQQFAVGG